MSLRSRLPFSNFLLESILISLRIIMCLMHQHCLRSDGLVPAYVLAYFHAFVRWRCASLPCYLGLSAVGHEVDDYPVEGRHSLPFTGLVRRPVLPVSLAWGMMLNLIRLIYSAHLY
jgi:hypothetical protein